MFQRSIPLFIVLFTALLLIVAFFIPHKPFGDLESRFLNWYAIISGFTFLLGLDSLTRHHLLKVIRREKRLVLQPPAGSEPFRDPNSRTLLLGKILQPLCPAGTVYVALQVYDYTTAGNDVRHPRLFHLFGCLSGISHS